MSRGSATGGTGGTRPPIFESAGDNPPHFQENSGPNPLSFRFLVWVTLWKNPGFAAAWSPSPPFSSAWRSPWLWACKAKTCHFSRKFDLWPDLTRSNIDLGPRTICAIARSRRGASSGLFREALRLSGTDRQGGSYQPPPPWPSALWEMPWPGEG